MIDEQICDNYDDICETEDNVNDFQSSSSNYTPSDKKQNIKKNNLIL